MSFPPPDLSGAVAGSRVVRNRLMIGGIAAATLAPLVSWSQIPQNREFMTASKLTLYQISEMHGLSGIGTEDFLGRHHVPLATIDEADLDREAAPLDTDSLARVHMRGA